MSFSKEDKVPAGAVANLLLRIRDQTGKHIILPCAPTAVDIFDPRDANKPVATIGPSKFQRPDEYRMDYQLADNAVPGIWKARWHVTYTFRGTTFTEKIPYFFEVTDR